MARNYVALPHDYLTLFQPLSYEEIGRLALWLLQYSATGEIGELTGREAVLLPQLRMKEDQFQARFEEVDAVNQERAKKAAAARWGKQDDAPSMLEDAPDANNKDKDKDNNKNNNKDKHSRKDSRKDNIRPSSEGKDSKPAESAPGLSPEAAAMQEKVEASMRRLRAYHRELEQDEPAYYSLS